MCRFIYFYYTQQAQLMSFDDFMLFAEDFGVSPMQMNPNELGLIFQSAGSVVRGGCLSYHEFVVCLSRCALRAGGSSATRAVNDFFERVVASDAYAGKCILPLYLSASLPQCLVTSVPHYLTATLLRCITVAD